MTSRVRKLQRQIAHDMRAEIQAQVLSLSQRKVRYSVKDDFLLLGTVALFELKTAHRLGNAVMKGRCQFCRPVQKFRVIVRMKILNDTDQCHYSSCSMSFLCILCSAFCSAAAQAEHAQISLIFKFPSRSSMCTDLSPTGIVQSSLSKYRTAGFTS